MGIEILQPHLLHWLWAVAAVAVLGAVRLEHSRRSMRRFAESALLRALAPHASPARSWLRLILGSAGLGLVVVAMADVRWGVIYTDVPRRGLDVVFLLDVSRSMLAQDAAPDRLSRAKQSIGDIVETFAGDRVALTVFAGDATLTCPLTLNYDALQSSLREADVRDAARGGTLLGDGIRTAVEAFVDDDPEGKVVVVVTDGEDHGSLPVEAAAQAFAERGARIFTIGIGDPIDGATVPVRVDGRIAPLTFEGQEVRSRMDESLLSEVALAGQGGFIPLGTSNADLGSIFTRLTDGLEMRETGAGPVRRFRPRYQLFAGLALALLVAESLVPGRRRGSRRDAPTSEGRP